MFERRFRRRRSLRSVLLFAIGFCSLSACFSWYTLLCCRPNMYGEYVINNYPPFPASGILNDISSQTYSTINSLGNFNQNAKVDTKLENGESNFDEKTRIKRIAGSHKRTGLIRNGNGTQNRKYVKQTLATDEVHPVLQYGAEENGSNRLSDTIQTRLTNSEFISPTTSPQSIPPTVELDQYVVKAWLPRGIKERIEANSYENQQSDTESDTSSLDSLPIASSVTTASYGYGMQPPRKRSVISPPIKRLPQALIIGVKKCGTRALLEFLRVHPDIRASGPETHFFDRHYQRGLDWYKQQMPTSLEGQITMEKTPSYFITKEVPPRIHSMSPSVRLLVVVRDPVTRAISDYTQSTSKRKDTPSFEEMAFLNVSTGLVDTSWSAIRIGVYARFLEWWTRYFSLDSILFISGENLIRDPAGEMGRVQDFLDLKQVISDKHFYFNETKGFPCLKKSEGSGNPHCLGKTKGRAHPDISLSTIQRLRDFYRPFNMKFYQMVGRNFGWP